MTAEGRERGRVVRDDVRRGSERTDYLWPCRPLLRTLAFILNGNVGF